MNPLSGVLWGSATSAYQTEGTTGHRIPTIWDTFEQRDGAIRRGDTGRDACRSYSDPEPMLDAISWLGLDVFRLSVAWSRLLTPPDGNANPEGVAYYRRVLQGLIDRGVRPVVTLYHWDLPQHLQDAGGWSSTETVSAFLQTVEVAVDRLGDLVSDWITVNEPFCAAFHGHLSGLHAPGIKDERVALRAALMQLHAHAEATRSIRRLAPDAKVGLAINLSDLEAASESRQDQRALTRTDLVENRLFLEPLFLGKLPEDTVDYFGPDAVAYATSDLNIPGIAETLDFIGVNYYEHNVIRAGDPGNDPVVRGIEKLPVPEPRSANGVAVCPTGFERVLLRVAALAPGLPIRVTENGIGLFDYRSPDSECRDKERVKFLDLYLEALGNAITKGAPVQEYYHWSLMDNFEWASGYQLRYGLFYTDFPTGRLYPKTSAHHYREKIAKGHTSTARQGCGGSNEGEST